MAILFSKSIISGCITFIILSNFAYSQNNTQWGAWENCSVFRSRYRVCNGNASNCAGPEYNNDTLNYTTCPILTADDIATVTESRQTQTNQTLSAIKNQTQATIDQIHETYKTSIATSTGFGYIAAIFIALIFAMPLLMDIHKFIVYMVERKKIHSETTVVGKNNTKTDNNDLNESNKKGTNSSSTKSRNKSVLKTRQQPPPQYIESSDA